MDVRWWPMRVNCETRVHRHNVKCQWKYYVDEGWPSEENCHVGCDWTFDCINLLYQNECRWKAIYRNCVFVFSGRPTVAPPTSCNAAIVRICIMHSAFTIHSALLILHIQISGEGKVWFSRKEKPEKTIKFAFM